MERRSIETEIRFDTQHGFSGYAARFYDGTPGTQHEILPGLFERIDPKAFQSITRDVVALYNHDSNLPLARVSAKSLKLRVDRDGLRFDMKYNSADADHRRLKQKVEGGIIKGCSFGFNIREAEFMQDNGQDVHLIRDADLIEVSPCVFPAYSETSLSFRNTEHIRQLQDQYEAWKRTQERLERIKKFSKEAK